MLNVKMALWLPNLVNYPLTKVSWYFVMFWNNLALEVISTRMWSKGVLTPTLMKNIFYHKVLLLSRTVSRSVIRFFNLFQILTFFKLTDYQPNSYWPIRLRYSLNLNICEINRGLKLIFSFWINILRGSEFSFFKCVWLDVSRHG